MASMPPGPPPPAGDLPALPQGGPAGGVGGQDQAAMMGGTPAPDGGMPTEMLQTLIKAAGDIDQMLGNMADAFGQDGGAEVAQARQLIQAGAGKFLAKYGVTPGAGGMEGGPGGPPPPPGGPGAGLPSAGAGPPTSGFPGGGFTSV